MRNHDYRGARSDAPATPAGDNAHDTYVFAVALNSTGASAEAMTLLKSTQHQRPADQRGADRARLDRPRQGDLAAVLRYARELLTLDPGNTPLQALVSELDKKSRP